MEEQIDYLDKGIIEAVGNALQGGSLPPHDLARVGQALRPVCDFECLCLEGHRRPCLT